MEPFSLTDVLGLASPKITPESRTFTVQGKPFNVTIRVDGKSDAAFFFELITCASAAQQLCDPVLAGKEGRPIGVRTFDPDGNLIEVVNQAYLAQLLMLEKASISPKFTLDHWLITQHRFGFDVMEEITDWVANANGVGTYFVKQLEQLKNALGGAGSTVPSSPPASASFKKPRAKPCEK